MLQNKKLIFLVIISYLLIVPVGTQAAIHHVNIGDNFFSPLKTIVAPGDTVRWTWVGGFPHSTTADTGSPKLWDSGILGGGATFDVVFTAGDGPGPFPYHCAVHSLTMKDTIFVAAAADTDGDGINDSDETTIGTNPMLADSDGDGVDDLTEVGNIASPTDTDSDTIIDALDDDDDNDGILTIDELANGDTDADTIPDYLDFDDDDDGVLTISDNCPLVDNPLQQDTNMNGIGDACDICCLGIRGNVDADVADQIDIADLVYFVSFSFSGGPAPTCIEEADVDNSLSLDIGDIVYLVSFMFSGGPAPLSCI